MAYICTFDSSVETFDSGVATFDQAGAMADLCTFDSSLTTFDSSLRTFDQTTCQAAEVVTQQRLNLKRGGGHSHAISRLANQARLARLAREHRKNELPPPEPVVVQPDPVVVTRTTVSVEGILGKELPKVVQKTKVVRKPIEEDNELEVVFLAAML
jgi:hypothetical protein